MSKSSDDEYLNETEVRDDLEVNDAESPNEALESAKSNRAWFERQLAYMIPIRSNSSIYLLPLRPE